MPKCPWPYQPSLQEILKGRHSSLFPDNHKSSLADHEQPFKNQQAGDNHLNQLVHSLTSSHNK